MADCKCISLKELSNLIDAELIGDGNKLIKGIQALDLANEDEVSFIVSKAYLEKAKGTKAGALIVPKNLHTDFTIPLLRVDDPYLAYAIVSQYFSEREWTPLGISKLAHIGQNTTISPNVSIYPYVYIGDNVTIGDRVTIFPFVFVGNNVTIDEDTTIFPNVTIYNGSKIGKRVIIHAGTVIGSDGFGYARRGKEHVKIPQTGIVVIEDDVEIGSNCSVDRAALGQTRIGRGTKIDNLVQIAHNVQIGANSIIVAQVGIAGSCKIGENVMIGGQAGLVGHIEIGDGAMIAAQSGVTKSVPPSEMVSGSPAINHKHFLRVVSELKKLPDYIKELRELSQRVLDLEKKLENK